LRGVDWLRLLSYVDAVSSTIHDHRRSVRCVLLPGVLLAVALSSAAWAQSDHPRPDTAHDAEDKCLGEHSGADARRFCTCWVTPWVQLWNEDDRSEWSKTGTATRHIDAMEKVATGQCDAWHHEIAP